MKDLFFMFILSAILTVPMLLCTAIFYHRFGIGLMILVPVSIIIGTLAMITEL